MLSLHRGSDLAPSAQDSLSTNGVSKTVSRIINAEQVRSAAKAKRKAAELESADKIAASATIAKKLKIQPHESLRKFSERAEKELRPELTQAIKTASKLNNAHKLNKAQKKKLKLADERAQLGEETEFYGFDKEERPQKEFKPVERVGLNDCQSFCDVTRMLASHDVVL